MNEFDFGRFLGMQSLEDAQQPVFRVAPKQKRRRAKIPEIYNYPGKTIEIRRNCDNCWKVAKLRVGSDLAWVDGQPVVLPMPVILIEGEVMVPVDLILTLQKNANKMKC